MHFELLNVNLFLQCTRYSTVYQLIFVLFYMVIIMRIDHLQFFLQNFVSGKILILAGCPIAISYTVPPASVEPHASLLTLVSKLDAPIYKHTSPSMGNLISSM